MQTHALKLALELQRRAQDLVDALQNSSNKPGDLPAIEAHSHLRHSTRELERMFVQPGEFLMQLAVSQQLLMCIHWLCYFNVVSVVPTGSDETITYVELARKADVPITTLKSVARMAIVFGFFRETSDGDLQHTSLSSSFARDTDVYNWMMYMAKETAPTVAHFVQATERWPGSENKSETAYSLSRGTDLAFFDHINTSPELAEEFGRYMKSQAANRKGTSTDLLAEGFDWGSLGKAIVVDVSRSNLLFQFDSTLTSSSRSVAAVAMRLSRLRRSSACWISLCKIYQQQSQQRGNELEHCQKRFQNGSGIKSTIFLTLNP